MNTNKDSSALPTQPSLLRNWISLIGLVVAIGALFSFFLLCLLDALASFPNPYLGILTYCVVPALSSVLS